MPGQEPENLSLLDYFVLACAVTIGLVIVLSLMEVLVGAAQRGG